MKKLFIILIASFITYNCESDDICPESTLTTPRMIITFYDVNNPEERKNVESLGVYIVKNRGEDICHYSSKEIINNVGITGKWLKTKCDNN